MPRLRFGTGSAILPLCLCEADESQPKQSRRGPEFATHLSGARNDNKKNRADLFFFKRKGGQLHAAPPSFKPLSFPAVASRSNLYIIASPGKSACNLIEIPLLLTGNQARTLCQC